ncbi:flagella assembly protein FlgT middle domain-containing protein [Marinobacter sp. W-8]|uniref:flagella assembly protein FlgT middle domain-containing protein n=1 Tax=Marinobacter sp. W-8 TaxID=3369658 RepID=UPI0037C61D3A
MIKNQHNVDAQAPRWLMASVVCLGLVLAPGGVRSADRNVVSEQTESFLESGSSVGALVGGILAGASFANPFAPLGGTIIGFFVGKSTDFSEKNESDVRYSRRSFAPVSAETTTEAGSLALSGNGSGESASLVFADDADIDAGDGSITVDQGPDSDKDSGQGDSPETAQVKVDGAEQEAAPGVSVSEPAFEPVNLVITKNVGGFQKDLDELAEIIRREQDRPEFIPSERCPERDAPRYRKKVAVAGFTLEHPDQASLGGLSEAGSSVSEILYQHFSRQGELLPYMAQNWQMYASLDSAPTTRDFTNQLNKYSAVSREMGAQFVVSGVIRSVAVRNAGTWGSSVYSKTKRKMFGGDEGRSFVLDVVVHDGYTGRVVFEKRYETSGAWEPDRYEMVGFGTARFAETGYGQAVSELLSDVSKEVSDRLACQPMLVPILEVSGQDLVLDVGTDSGLLPGDKMKIVRAQSSWRNLDGPPRLVDAGVWLHIHELTLDRAHAWMPKQGSVVNIQSGDYAVIY